MQSDTQKSVLFFLSKSKYNNTMEITIHDIDRIHRLGKHKLDNNVSRPIIVKFVRYKVRNRIFKTKKKLKGKNVSITESLTKRRVIELKKARLGMCDHMTVKFYF